MVTAVSEAFSQEAILAERERLRGVIATKKGELKAATALLAEWNKISALYGQLDEEPEFLCSQRGCGRSFPTMNGLNRHKAIHRRAVS